MLFFILAPVLSNATCYPYQCAPSDYTMPKNYCAVSYNGTFFLEPCSSSSEICDLTTGKCKESSPVDPTLNYPGEICDSNSDCSSNVCTSNICIGKSVDESCAHHEDCNPGLRCYQSVCQKQLDITVYGCIDDYDCVNYASCNKTTSYMGTCYSYFSVSIGETVTDCHSGLSYLCSSAECSKIPVFGNYGVCKTATISDYTIPTDCTSNLNCTGSDGTYEYTSECRCGYNNNGTSYCSLFSGDLPSLAYFNMWKNALTASAGTCNTARRFSYDCLERTGYYKKVMMATWDYLYYPEMQNNDDCVMSMINYEGYDIDLSLVILPLFSFLLFSSI